MKPGELAWGWRPVERVSALIVTSWPMSVLKVTHVVSDHLGEVSILTRRFLGVSRGRSVVVAGSTLVDHALGLKAGTYALDPQLCRHDIDDRRVIVVPSLDLRVSVPAPRGSTGRGSSGVDRRPVGVRIERLAVGAGSATDSAQSGLGDWEGLEGLHLGVHTRWPLRASGVTEAIPVRAPTSTRLAAGPAAFLREERDDRVAV